MIKATPLLKNKLWVLEQDGQKIGALQLSEDGYTVIREEKKEKFFTPEELAQHYAITYEKARPKSKKQKVLYDFPTNTTPHNELYDVQHSVPIFTKGEKSKSFYCAGYFIVNSIGNVWEKIHCPKLLIVQRYPHLGPFKTKEEMNAAYKNI